MAKRVEDYRSDDWAAECELWQTTRIRAAGEAIVWMAVAWSVAAVVIWLTA